MPALIGHLILSVSDFVASARFYDSMLLPLGFKSDWSQDDGSLAIKHYASQGHTVFIRCDRSREHREFVRDVGLDHLAFKVADRSEVDAAFLKLTRDMKVEAKAPREFPEYSSLYYAFYFRDPDGIPLEIA